MPKPSRRIPGTPKPLERPGAPAKKGRRAPNLPKNAPDGTTPKSPKPMMKPDTPMRRRKKGIE